jgi:hypothetical protein
MLGARFCICVAEDGRLTFLRAHAALRRMCAWHVKSGCCWLLLLPPTQCVQARIGGHALQGTAGTVHRKGNVRLQDFRFTGPFVNYLKSGPIRGRLENRATVKAKGFYGTVEILCLPVPGSFLGAGNQKL